MTNEDRDEVRQIVQSVLQQEGVAIDDNTVFPLKNSAGQDDALLMMQLDQQHQATDYSRINAENLPGGGGGGITIDSALSPTSEMPVQNKVIYKKLMDYYAKQESDMKYQPKGNYATEQQLAGKVDEEPGKGLSTNDYTNEDKAKVAAAITEHQDISGKADKSEIVAEKNRAEAAEEQLRAYCEALSQSKPIPKTSAEWAAMTSWQEGVIYRVAGTTSYADWMYNGTTTIKMAEYDNAIDTNPIKESENLAKSGGIYNSLILAKESIEEIKSSTSRKTSISTVTGERRLGYFFNYGTDAFAANQYMQCDIIDVENEKFYQTSGAWHPSGMSAMYMVCFLDASSHRIGAAEYVESSQGVVMSLTDLTIPYGTSKIVVNSYYNTTPTNVTVNSYEYIAIQSKELEDSIEQLEASVSENENAINELTSSLQKKTNITTITTDRRLGYWYNSNANDFVANQYMQCDVFSISAGKKYQAGGAWHPAGLVAMYLVCYLDNEDNFISGESYVESSDSVVLPMAELNIPSSAAKVVVNSYYNSTSPTDVIVQSYEYYLVINELKRLKVHIYDMGAQLFHVRASYNSDKDIIMLYGKNNNCCVSPKAVYVGSKTLADNDLINDTYLMCSCGDSTAPLMGSEVYWHLFQQHGYLIPAMTNSYGMTSADVGSVWIDQLNRKYTIGYVLPTYVFLLPEIYVEDGKYTRGWKTPSSPAITRLTHVSGGSYTSDIDNPVIGQHQQYPIMKSENRKYICDGKTITDTGDYDCDEFQCCETTIGYDPASIQTWFPTTVLTGAREMARFTWSYNFAGPNCCVNTTIMILSKIECERYGAVQQQFFVDKGDYQSMIMIPKAASRNGVELDKPYHSTINSQGYVFYRQAGFLKDVNDIIDRQVGFLYNPNNDDYLFGMAAGLSLVSGDTIKEKRNQNIPVFVGQNYDPHWTAGLASPENVNKFYISAVNTAPFADDDYQFPDTYFKEINYYVSFFDPAENEGQVYWYKDGNGYIIYAHCQSMQNRLAINVSEVMEGLKLSIVEKTDNAKLLTDTIQDGKFFVNFTSNDANYIVVKAV